MGKRDDRDWRKRREREDEDEASYQSRVVQNRTGSPLNAKDGGPPLSSLQDLLDRIPPLIEQVNQLYNMYFSGAEKRPPVERRQYLDQCIAQLGAFPKPTQAAQFRATTLLQTYQTHKDRWDRLLKQRER